MVELKDFPLHTIAALRELIPADRGCHAELDTQALHAITVFDPEERVTQTLRESWSGHLLSPTSLQRWATQPSLVTALFGPELDQPRELGLHHLAFGFRTDPDLVVIVSLHREGGDFTNHERDLLADVAPFVAVGRRNAQRHAALRETRIVDLRLNWVSTALVPVSRSGHVGLLSTSARRWLIDFFGGLPPCSGRLPQSILSWLSRHLDECKHGWRKPRPLTKRAAVGEAELILGLAGTPQSGLVLTLQHKQPIPSPLIADLFNLCPREVEVLRWRLANKNRNEIAEILGIKPGTVKTHVQNLYAKLGIDAEDGSSVAAATLVFDRLSQLPPEQTDAPRDGDGGE